APAALVAWFPQLGLRGAWAHWSPPLEARLGRGRRPRRLGELQPLELVLQWHLPFQERSQFHCRRPLRHPSLLEMEWLLRGLPRLWPRRRLSLERVLAVTYDMLGQRHIDFREG
ncbi:unnamed protein product, partial [Prorocentrum cordatum]